MSGKWAENFENFAYSMQVISSKKKIGQMQLDIEKEPTHKHFIFKPGKNKSWTNHNFNIEIGLLTSQGLTDLSNYIFKNSLQKMPVFLAVNQKINNTRGVNMQCFPSFYPSQGTNQHFIYLSVAHSKVPFIG